MKTYYSDGKTCSVIFVKNGLFTKDSGSSGTLTFYKYDRIEKVYVSFEKETGETFLTILERDEEEYFKIFNVSNFKNHLEIFEEIQKRLIEYQNRDFTPLLLDIKESLLALVYAPGGSQFETAKKSFEENTNHLN